MRHFIFACLALFIPYANAQTTVTVLNAAGLSVVEVISTDPVQGIPITQTIATLTSAAAAVSTGSTTATTPTIPTTPTIATTATTAVTTPPVVTQPPVQQGPVGQPGPTTGVPNGPTPYVYTTVVNGVTTSLTDVFIPTTPATTPTTAGTSGTVLPYSVWLSIYGPTSTTATANRAGRVEVPSQGWWGLLAAAFYGVVGGVWLVLL